MNTLNSNPEAATGKDGNNNRPELSFDGCGINGQDEYRTRIATFSNHADKYGRLFAAAPELLQALKELVYRNDIMLGYAVRGETETRWTHKQSISQPGELATNNALMKALQQARTAIANAEPH